MQNGTIKLEATSYVGTYDGQEHNALSNISVEPRDAKLEYSLDGENYVTEMPKIKDTSEFTVTVVASKEGYKTVSTTETIKVNRAEGKLVLSLYSGTLTYPNSTSFTINENTTNVNITSSNTNIATASLNGNTVTVKPGTTAGKAIITVTTEETINYTSKTATYEATVKNGSIDLRVTPYTGTYDGRQHNAVTVNVTPSDAKIEYSINGGTYSTTMPTITNTSSFTVTVKASKAGYKTQTTTETVKVNKANGSLTLSATSGTIAYQNNTSFTVSNNTGSLSVSSSNSNIASASISGNTVTVKSGTTAGKATITVTSAEAANYTAKSATYTVNVQNGTISLSATPYSGTYDGRAHNAITNVNVNPADAKIEYSTNGTSYSTTMPTITNTSSFTVTIRATKTGYKTQSTTQTVKVNKAAGTLTLSATSGTINYPNSTTFTVSGNTGTLSVSSNNNNVATASISGNTVTVKPGKTAGSATITVKSAASTNYNEKTATYTVTVKNPTFTEGSGVGYYADTDGNGTPDGIIFADFKNGGSGSWGGTSYTVSTVTGLKEYYISQTNYKGPFGTKNVLSARESGNARFNVMALSDYNSATYTFTNAKSITSGEWRVPTNNEWAAFGGQLGITTSNYSGYGVKAKYYWSSSPIRSSGYLVDFRLGKITYSLDDSLPSSVRLARTF